jgi:hypothetical protein
MFTDEKDDETFTDEKVLISCLGGDMIQKYQMQTQQEQKQEQKLEQEQEREE